MIGSHTEKKKIKLKITIEIVLIIAIVLCIASAVVLFFTKSLEFNNYVQRHRASQYIAYCILLFAFSIGLIIVCAFLLERRRALQHKTLKFPWMIFCAAFVIIAQLFILHKPTRYVHLAHIGMDCLILWCCPTTVVQAAFQIAQKLFWFYYALIFILAIWVMYIKLSGKSSSQMSIEQMIMTTKIEQH